MVMGVGKYTIGGLKERSPNNFNSIVPNNLKNQASKEFFSKPKLSLNTIETSFHIENAFKTMVNKKNFFTSRNSSIIEQNKFASMRMPDSLPDFSPVLKSPRSPDYITKTKLMSGSFSKLPA
mgnify:CR=1 FL=1